MTCSTFEQAERIIMAKTREQIRTSVGYNTGRGVEKESLINSLCNEALKVACNAHAFRDSRSEPSAFSITEDATSVDISTITGLIHIVTARIVEDSSNSYQPLIMKERSYWDRYIVDPSRNQKGWPMYGLRWGTTVILDRPSESGLSLKLVVSTEQSFSADSTECPVAILDTFVTQYATAFVFLSIENVESYNFWKRLALGPRWDEGIVGGTLLHAVQTDKYDLSEEMKAETYLPEGPRGVSIRNLLSGHDDYGNVRTWY